MRFSLQEEFPCSGILRINEQRASYAYATPLLNFKSTDFESLLLMFQWQKCHFKIFFLFHKESRFVFLMQDFEKKSSFNHIALMY